MNHVQEKVFVASASHIIYGYGSYQPVVFPMMQRRPLIDPLNFFLD